MHMELFRQNPHLHHLQQQPSISLLSDSTPLSGNAASLFMYQDINDSSNKLKKFRMATSSGGSDDIFEDEYLLYSSSDTLNPSYWDCDGCPPPEFHLPPPPRPPWMEELDGCDKSEYTTLDDGRVTSSPSLKEILNSLDNTCDNTIVLNDSQSYFEDTFHSIAVIIVCSVVLVIMLLIIGVVIFRRRKNLYSHHQNHSLGSVSGTGSGCQSSVLGAVQGTHIGNQSAIHHQLTLQKVGTQLRHHLSPALSLTSTLSSNQQQKYQPQHLNAVPSELLVTASGASIPNVDGGPINHLRNISATLFNRNPGNHQTNVRTKPLYCGGELPGSKIDDLVNSGRLPNHYIPELPSGSFTIGHNLQEHPRMLVINNGDNTVGGKRQMVIEDFRQRFVDPAQTRNVMELSERPPMLTPTSVSQPNFPPHILIGGQPFYLVPTSSASSSTNNGLNDTTGEQYTYPQNIMPIYEEIDSNNSRIYATGLGGDVVTNSDFEYYCAQPGPESTSEVRKPNDTQALRLARVQMGEGISRNAQIIGNHQVNMQHLPVTSTGNSARPVSSSTSNSQHTNTSELSSNSSNDGNISGIQHPLQQHVLINPLSSALSNEDIKSGKFLLMADTSFSSDYVNSSTNSGGDQHSKLPPHPNTHLSPKYPPRLADGFERCRSPQSVYSAKLAFKAAQQRGSPSSSSTSGASSGGGSKGSSVYYYSDTLRKPDRLNNCKQQTKGNVISNKMYESETSSDQQPIASPRFLNNATNASTSDESDSGIGAKFECSPSTNSKENMRRRNNFDFNGDFAGSDCSSSTPQHIPSISSQSTHTMSPGPPVSTKVVLDDHHSSKKSALV